MTEETRPPRFWTDIANDPNNGIERRRLAVLQLFRGHVHPGMSLSALARTLKPLRWLKREDVSAVEVLAGLIPVTWTHEDTVFVLRIIPDDSDDSPPAIYLRISGKLPIDSFLTALFSEDVARKETDSVILEIGYETA